MTKPPYTPTESPNAINTLPKTYSPEIYGSLKSGIDCTRVAKLSEVRCNVNIGKPQNQGDPSHIPIWKFLFGDVGNNDGADHISKDDAEVQRRRKEMGMYEFIVVTEKHAGHSRHSEERQKSDHGGKNRLFGESTGVNDVERTNYLE